ncbi:MAG: hypothetical protein DMG10_29440 [Acidobacteria bacterium]|nr:MAG: hypothetical protein DMG10_29440 [Acidobacteriota bacterium]
MSGQQLHRLQMALAHGKVDWLGVPVSGVVKSWGPDSCQYSRSFSYYYVENPSRAGKDFSTDGKRFVILRVFVVRFFWLRLGCSVFIRGFVRSFGCGSAAPWNSWPRNIATN